MEFSVKLKESLARIDEDVVHEYICSSEIGYAGSPPREVLTRGRSIDSVDRPFHPSDWVDVNLEVPSTPRAASVLTNLTVDTNLYPATTPTSSCKLAIYRYLVLQPVSLTRTRSFRHAGRQTWRNALAFISLAFSESLFPSSFRIEKAVVGRHVGNTFAK